MFSVVLSSALNGIDGYIVKVEIDISDGLPSFEIVGLPDSSVKESKERVRTAIKNSNFSFPIKKITVNLAPADTRKEGSAFDLPIAVGILICIGAIKPGKLKDTIVIGELSLDGSIRGVSGILPMVYSAYNKGIKKCIVPFENAKEGAIVKNIEIIAVNSLTEIVEHLSGYKLVDKVNIDINELFESDNEINNLDFADVKGQSKVKRALEVAVSGFHNILMLGTPGSGKTMMAKRISSIFPPLTFEESIEITKIHSVAGFLKDKGTLITKRPFRSPHHTISASALIGGGKIPKPGEISLAHNGVLFLDELPEFKKNVLEVMRQPLEDMEVTIARVNSTITYPSKFMLIASMNPCPCGYYPDSKRCHCTQKEVKKYLSRISGPLIDRIDICLEVKPVDYNQLSTKHKAESSQDIRKKVIAAQKIQYERYKSENILFNSQLSSSQIEKYCNLGDKEVEILKMAFDKLSLSARAYHRILKVARTIADLDNSENIKVEHLAEAIQYRSLDRKYFS